MDSSSVEVFGGDGRVTISSHLFPVPLLLPAGTSLPLRIRAPGNRIGVFVDDRPLIDTTDTRFVRGRIGLNVFGGRTAYQDTSVTALQGDPPHARQTRRTGHR
ncbi:GH32 C-terminal domain-containing protein [Streptomyces sp. NPDC058620]|uniref:GH32 C-terminal domain-containing protein n=1 Tax=Streptomyces sp. NPDC058620 TaxID=3346560 RepID=UPI0036616990